MAKKSAVVSLPTGCCWGKGGEVTNPRIPDLLQPHRRGWGRINDKKNKGVVVIQISSYEIFLREKMGYGAICGGIIKESEWEKAVKETGGLGYMMCFILPDNVYDEYFKLLEQGKKKEASKLFKKHAWSAITGRK